MREIRLTAVEDQTLLMIAHGHTYAAIAEARGVSHVTVKNTVTRIKRKLSAATVIDALRVRGWLRPPTSSGAGLRTARLSAHGAVGNRRDEPLRVPAPLGSVRWVTS